MTSVLTKLLGRCFPCSARQEAENLSIGAETIEKKEGVSIDELHFVIPSMDFPKFESRRPEKGSELSVGEYMFFYRYITSKENFRQPGAEYQWVMYFFRDRSSIHLMKGWVPTKKCYENNFKLHDQQLRASIDRKVKLLHVNTLDKLYTFESENSALVKEQGNGLKSESTSLTQLVHLGLPLRKSAYNWGVINNWSRNVAPESDDNTPFDFAQNTNPGVYSSVSMDRLTKEINAVIEGTSFERGHGSRRCGSQGMVTSTIDTRHRRIRPGAAKGPRKPPVMCDKYRL